jgi:hypothetical protein
MRSSPISRARRTFFFIGCVRDLLHAVDVRREAGGDDALPVVGVEQVVQHVAHRGLRRRVAVLVGVRRVREQESDPVTLGDGADLGQVGEPPVDRSEVDLEVPRVQQHSLGGVEGGGEPVGHRVRDRDELDLEGSDGPTLAVDHRDQLGALEQACLFDAVAGQPEGEP